MEENNDKTIISQYHHCRPCTVSLKSSEDGVKKSMLFEFEERVTWILASKRHFSE